MLIPVIIQFRFWGSLHLCGILIIAVENIVPVNRSILVDGWQADTEERGLAFFDTSTAVRRLKDNAADQFLEVVEPTDITALLRHLPHCRSIVTTGEKATQTVCASLHLPIIPKVNEAVTIVPPLLLYRLPSSSRAYPLSFDKKVEAYRRMAEKVGLI